MHPRPQGRLCWGAAGSRLWPLHPGVLCICLLCHLRGLHWCGWVGSLVEGAASQCSDLKSKGRVKQGPKTSPRHMPAPASPTQGGLLWGLQSWGRQTALCICLWACFSGLRLEEAEHRPLRAPVLLLESWVQKELESLFCCPGGASGHSI